MLKVFWSKWLFILTLPRIPANACHRLFNNKYYERSETVVVVKQMVISRLLGGAQKKKDAKT